MVIAMTKLIKLINMKFITRFILSPITLVLLFSFLIISGKSSAYFYVILVVMGLSVSALHSIFGLAGIIILLSSFMTKEKQLIAVSRLLGALCLSTSLVMFFTQSGANYNYNTFTESLPLIFLIIFSLAVIFFIMNQIMILLPDRKPPSSVL